MCWGTVIQNFLCYIQYKQAIKGEKWSKSADISKPKEKKKHYQKKGKKDKLDRRNTTCQFVLNSHRTRKKHN